MHRLFKLSLAFGAGIIGAWVARAEPPAQLASLESPILLGGDDNVGYRDPLLIEHEGLFHMFFTLGQEDWPWARGRITAGYVADLRKLPAIGKYVMVFHGIGPEPEPTKFLTGGSIGIAWSDDLVHWSWPDKKPSKSRDEKVQP